MIFNPYVHFIIGFLRGANKLKVAGRKCISHKLLYSCVLLLLFMSWHFGVSDVIGPVDEDFQFTIFDLRTLVLRTAGDENILAV